MKKPRHATCNPKVITALTEDYKALMLRRLMIQSDNIIPSSFMYRIASCALTEFGVTRPYSHNAVKYVLFANTVLILIQYFLGQMSVLRDGLV